MQYTAAIPHVRAIAREAGPSRASSTRQRARLTARLVMGALVAAALLVSILSISHDPQAPLPASWATVSVSQNATLWGIAEAHPISGRSTPETVKLICAENGLADATIHAGQVLRVPDQAPTVALAQN